MPKCGIMIAGCSQGIPGPGSEILTLWKSENTGSKSCNLGEWVS